MNFFLANLLFNCVVSGTMNVEDGTLPFRVARGMFCGFFRKLNFIIVQCNY